MSRLLRKVKQNSKVETNLKTRLQGMFSLFYDVLEFGKLLKIDIILIVILLKKTTVSDDYSSQATIYRLHETKICVCGCSFYCFTASKHFISLEN